MSKYVGLTNFQKSVRFLAHPVYSFRTLTVLINFQNSFTVRISKKFSTKPLQNLPHLKCVSAVSWVTLQNVNAHNNYHI